MRVTTSGLNGPPYPADDLRQLYAQRWNIELHFAQIKTTLGLDVLRCQSPGMIQKELQIHLIAYNLVRALMQKAAHLYQVPLERLSFKGSLDTLRHWAAAIHASSKTPRKQAELIHRMLEAIAADPIPLAPRSIRAAGPKEKTQNLSASDPTPPRNEGHRPSRKIPRSSSQNRLILVPFVPVPFFLFP